MWDQTKLGAASFIWAKENSVVNFRLLRENSFALKTSHLYFLLFRKISSYQHAICEIPFRSHLQHHWNLDYLWHILDAHDNTKHHNQRYEIINQEASLEEVLCSCAGLKQVWGERLLSRPSHVTCNFSHAHTLLSDGLAFRSQSSLRT